MPPPDRPGRPAWNRCTGRADEAAILNVRTAPLSKDQPDHTDRQKAGVAEATQPWGGADNQREPGQQQLATHATQITSTTQRLPRTKNNESTEKTKNQIIISQNIRRNKRRRSPTPSWGGRGLGREDHECKDGHRKAEGRRSGPGGGSEGQKADRAGEKGYLPRVRGLKLARWRSLPGLLARR